MGPIFSCDSVDGHATCNDCFLTSKVCKCKANIKHRSKALETIRTTLPLSCQFRKNGCTIVHDCHFRMIFCPTLSCKDVPKIILRILEDQLTEHHKDIQNPNTSYTEHTFQPVTEKMLEWTNCGWGPQITKLVLNNAEVFSVMMMAMEKDLLYFWCKYAGSKGEAENYQITIKVFGGAGEEYIYNGHPRSRYESKTQIIQEGNALILCVSQVKRLLVNKDSLQCSVKMSCRKDEAKDEDVESESQIEMDLKKKLHNKLFEFLVCQNCKEVPKMGPIFSCDSVNGHATCNDCFLTSKVCKCKANIKHCSKALETIRTTLPLSCPHHAEGRVDPVDLALKNRNWF
jgi:hypothetical protein